MSEIWTDLESLRERHARSFDEYAAQWRLRERSLSTTARRLWYVENFLVGILTERWT